jgi:electron transport complex protein RnfA
MSALLLILLSTVLVNVMALTRMPAWRPFDGATDTYAEAQALAAASFVTVPVVAACSWAVSKLLLVPGDLGYLRTLAFVLIALVFVPVVEFLMRRDGRFLPRRPGFPLLLTTNSTVLGVALLVDSRMQTFVDAVGFSILAAAALGFLLLAFAAMYERLQHAEVPEIFRDAPLALVSVGIMALAFMGFTGLIQE